MLSRSHWDDSHGKKVGDSHQPNVNKTVKKTYGIIMIRKMATGN